MNEYNGIKVGDIIIAYHKGYHRLDSIECRLDSGMDSPLFHYTKVLNENGTKSSKVKKCSDAAWCRLASSVLSTRIAEKEQEVKDLTKFYVEIYVNPTEPYVKPTGHAICHTCGEFHEELPLHTCPYKSDVNGDDENLCNCCENCRHECAMNI